MEIYLKRDVLGKALMEDKAQRLTDRCVFIV